jgi:hypothetical protein
VRKKPVGKIKRSRKVSGSTKALKRKSARPSGKKPFSFSKPPRRIAKPLIQKLPVKETWPAAETHPEVILPREVAVINELPFSYGETKLVLMVRDPYWAYSYWDFSGETWVWCQKKLAEDSSLKAIMRIQDLDAKRYYDLLISLEAKNWYLHLGTPDHRYVAELGIGDGNSRFYLIARSNEVRTPRDSPSEVIDPEWKDRDFDEIYRLSGGGKPGMSSPGSFFFPKIP